ncbi:MAG: hypothetical protein M3004_00900 [Bacteroidota bacterium]|nr:hypothetical protein [Bacteroidota bacterium]
MQYEITFKNEKEHAYRLIILILVVLHALFFFYLLFDNNLWREGVAGLAIIALYTVYRIIIYKTTDQGFYYGAGFFLAFIVIYGILWLAILDGILGGLCYAALQKRSARLNPCLIEIKTYPYKRYKWADFTNVVLKDNILTLDLKTNKLFQREIETSVNENVFNAFVNEQLKKNI